MQIEMSIKGLMVDPLTNMPIVILRDQDGQRVLPIWVGIFEANAIALQMENIPTPRPMTHDLLRNVIQDLRATVEKIVVCDLQENTFYALIYLTVNGDTVASAAVSDNVAQQLDLHIGQVFNVTSASGDNYTLQYDDTAPENNRIDIYSKSGSLGGNSFSQHATTVTPLTVANFK